MDWTVTDDNDLLKKLETFYNVSFRENINTVKPAHVVTSIKQLPVLKGHPFLVLS
jgi:hypothetical protein